MNSLAPRAIARALALFSVGYSNRNEMTTTRGRCGHRLVVLSDDLIDLIFSPP